ncbi:hypothetical protein BofuT4_uP136340.1 [Botrytis cinerea T4]|uniref:Uncharacterized protein n=1 Tax=Botryotinia fuckeliana (strain T4) TaxID=999810 RepID=G2YPP1_BOTF4|nr:hypothetical protein BofuT4_uP136340.1 [Botrytis cinerea T4]
MHITYKCHTSSANPGIKEKLRLGYKFIPTKHANMTDQPVGEWYQAVDLIMRFKCKEKKKISRDGRSRG